MTERELEILWACRRAIVKKFSSNPECYKECDQCRAIVPRNTAICLYCGAYRFCEDPMQIQETAREMGKRPYPLAAAVVPRVKWFRTESGAGLRQAEGAAVVARIKREEKQ